MKINELCYNERFDSFSGLVANDFIRLAPDHTVFGYVFDGVVEYRRMDRLKRIFAGSFFSADSRFFVDDKLRVFGRSFISMMPGIRGHSIEGLLDLKGPGFVRYIDGCTDSLLICPPKLGEPCLNALYFPPNTVQTFHTHPSFRAGIVASGYGTASLQSSEQSLNVGDCFYI